MNSRGRATNLVELRLAPTLLKYNGRRHTVDKNIRRRAKLSALSLRDNLFSIGGLTEFRPHIMYDPILELPPLIQDFDLNMQQRSLQKYKGFSNNVSSEMVLEISPQSDQNCAYFAV